MKNQFSPPGIFLLVVFLCAFAGCATTQDVDILRTDVNRLLKDSYAAKSDIESLKERTAGAAKEESFNVVRMSQAEMQSQLATLTGEVQRLGGRFDENRYYLEKTLKDASSETELLKAQVAGLEKQIRDIKDRMIVMEGAGKQKGEPIKEEQAKASDKKPEDLQKDASPGDGKTAKPVSPGDAVLQYEEAYSFFKDKRYREARQKFDAFIKAYPNHELADNAHFWIAETYYNEKDFEEAILAYEAHMKKYPKSQKAPGSLLKQGLAFIEIEDKKTGTVILDQVIERYPKSAEADLARKQLEKIRKTKK